MVKRIEVTFSDNKRQLFENVTQITVNQTDFEVHFSNGNISFMPKQNIFTFVIVEEV